MKKRIIVIILVIFYIMGASNSSALIVTLADQFLQNVYIKFHYMEDGEERTHFDIDYTIDFSDESNITFFQQAGVLYAYIGCEHRYIKEQDYKYLWIHMNRSLEEELFSLTFIEDRDRVCDTLLLTTLDFSNGTIMFERDIEPKYVSILLGRGISPFSVHFYTEEALPDFLEFGVKYQVLSLEELDNVLDNQEVTDFYYADSGFRPETDGFSFANYGDTVFDKGHCSGMSYAAGLLYNYDRPIDLVWDQEVYILSDYDAIKKNVNDYIKRPTKYLEALIYKDLEQPVKRYPPVKPERLFGNNYLFLDSYIDAAVRITHQVWFSHPHDLFGWNAIDCVAAELRAGRVIEVCLSTQGSGHSVVAYKMQPDPEDKDLVRLYCYDSNFPNDLYYSYTGDISGIDGGDIIPNGWFLDCKEANRNYIELRRVVSPRGDIVYEGFCKLSFPFATTEELAKQHGVSRGQIRFKYLHENYNILVGSRSDQIIGVKVYPVYVNEKQIDVRVFVFMEDGTCTEVTDCKSTQVYFDFSYIGKYKIKGMSIHALGDTVFANEKTDEYVDFTVGFGNVWGARFMKQKFRVFLKGDEV